MISKKIIGAALLVLGLLLILLGANTICLGCPPEAVSIPAIMQFAGLAAAILGVIVLVWAFIKKK